MKAKIAIAGDGNVGSGLQKGLARAGHEATAVGREPKKLREKALEASVIIVAVPYGAVDDTLRELGDAVNGKVLVDATNALAKDMTGLPGVCAAEELQKKAPRARVVKAFNTTFAGTMPAGGVKGEKITLFVASDDQAAKDTVIALGKDIGFDALDAGPLGNARYLEAMAVLLIQLGYGLKMGAEIGFRLIR
jgi:predicted dinucleotide-binding enzyme